LSDAHARDPWAEAAWKIGKEATGRSLKYLRLAACERFGKDPFRWFTRLSWAQQIDLLVYEAIRQQEHSSCPLG